MNYPFDIEICVFDKNCEMTSEMLMTREKMLHGDLYKIIYKAMKKLKHKYKLTTTSDTAEAPSHYTISTHDGVKQIVLSTHTLATNVPKYMYSIYFIQKQSNHAYFTIIELKEFADFIQYQLEKYLKKSIDDPILFIDTGCI